MSSKFGRWRTALRLFLSFAVAAAPLAMMPASAQAAVPIDSNFTVKDLNNGVTATDLANELVGGGVTVSSVTYTGNNRAAGRFTVNDLTTLGFGKGIVLSSGKVQTYVTDPACSRGIEGPNNCHESWAFPAPGGPAGPDGFANSTAFNGPGDTDLTALSGFTTFDASILEFDFVPQFGTVQFQYVFSSEEYSDFANTAFNDVFGFFVNGKNCAWVPGTTSTPVSINTINNGNDQQGADHTPHNATFFRDNVRPSSTIDIQMDGLTTVFTCTATVNAGVKNHMKLAIADASDAILDSAVFLKGGSLISGTVMTTSLKGAGQSGPAITVPQGTSVTDSATLNGANASTATGTVTYKVYSDATCQTLFASAGTKNVTGGVVPDSDPVTMSAAGTFYWVASYSGDALNNASSNPCGSETVTVTSGEGPIVATGATVSATEGQSLTGSVASFTDPDPSSTAAEYSATISWGDGGSSAGTITGPTGGPFNVSGTHTYADEGTYSIGVAITDKDTPTNNATANSTANVGDAALTAGQLSLTAGTEGSGAVTATLDFSDANTGSTAADFTATVTWGDGSSSSGTVIAHSGGSYTVKAAHTYNEEGTYSVTTSVKDDGGSTASAGRNATVADGALTPTCATPALFTQDFNGPTATFSDMASPGGTLSDFTATISWGDGTSSAGTITGPNGGPYTVSGTHRYATTHNFTITTSIVDVGGSTAKISCNILVFAFAPGGGSFVIGDGDSSVGTEVTFWGAQWWKLNTLSGGRAPASFKGFAESPAVPACQVDWNADPGNSTPPPDGPLPTYMGVIVTSAADKLGSQTSGNTVHLVVVKTNPGYAPDPGSPGTGTVVAQVC